MHLKIHRAYRNVVALADSELLGKKFEEEKFQLDVRENFYKDKDSPAILTKSEVIKILKRQQLEDSTYNIVGPKSIQAALEAGIIEKENVGKIAGIPYALTLIYLNSLATFY